MPSGNLSLIKTKIRSLIAIFTSGAVASAEESLSDGGEQCMRYSVEFVGALPRGPKGLVGNGRSGHAQKPCQLEAQNDLDGLECCPQEPFGRQTARLDAFGTEEQPGHACALRPQAARSRAGARTRTVGNVR